jgi:hypothetical protein
MRFSLKKCWTDLQAPALAAEDRPVRHLDVAQRHAPVVGRHVEGPEVLLDLEAAAVGRDRGTP